MKERNFIPLIPREDMKCKFPVKNDQARAFRSSLRGGRRQGEDRYPGCHRREQKFQVGNFCGDIFKEVFGVDVKLERVENEKTRSVFRMSFRLPLHFHCFPTAFTFISIFSSGLSFLSLGCLEIFSATWMPETTSPKTVYCPLNSGPHPGR